MPAKAVDITEGGPCLYYDSTLKLFSLRDRANEDEPFSVLGPVEQAMLYLQDDLGLDHSQAMEAINSAFGNSGAPIRIDHIKLSAAAGAKATIVVNMDNATFEEASEQEELTRILRHVADHVADKVSAGSTHGRILDVNGNTVGTFAIGLSDKIASAHNWRAGSVAAQCLTAIDDVIARLEKAIVRHRGDWNLRAEIEKALAPVQTARKALVTLYERTGSPPELAPVTRKTKASTDDVVAKWQSRNGKYWLYIYKDQHGYSYRHNTGGGFLGNGKDQAIANIEARLSTFAPDSYKTRLNRVKLGEEAAVTHSKHAAHTKAYWNAYTTLEGTAARVRQSRIALHDLLSRLENGNDPDFVEGIDKHTVNVIVKAIDICTQASNQIHKLMNELIETDA